MRPVRAYARVTYLCGAVALLSVAVLLAGCDTGGSPAAGSGGNQTVTVAVVPGVDNAAVRIAVHDGIFKQHGLTVVVKKYSSLSQVVTALRSGRAQVAAGDYTSFFYLADTGNVKLRLIADGYDAVPNMLEILTLPGSGITTPEQLVGKSVATPERTVFYPHNPSNNTSFLPYNIETLAAQTVIESDGVSPTTVNWKPMPAQNMIKTLQNGTVKAILAPEPYLLEAQRQLGAQVVLDAGSGVTSGLPLSGYFSLAPFAQSAALSRFRAALLQAQSDASMGGPVQAVLPSTTGMSAQDAALITLGSYPTSLSVGQVQRVAQLMFQSGMIGNALNVRTMVAG